jgi:hypothetical protein
MSSNNSAVHINNDHKIILTAIKANTPIPPTFFPTEALNCAFVTEGGQVLVVDGVRKNNVYDDNGVKTGAVEEKSEAYEPVQKLHKRDAKAAGDAPYDDAYNFKLPEKEQAESRTKVTQSFSATFKNMSADYADLLLPFEARARVFVITRDKPQENGILVTVNFLFAVVVLSDFEIQELDKKLRAAAQAGKSQAKGLHHYRKANGFFWFAQDLQNAIAVTLEKRKKAAAAAVVAEAK